MGKKLFVVGQMSLQNLLLRCFIEENTGLRCDFSHDVSIPAGDGKGGTFLVLWDCAGERFDALLESLDKMGSVDDDYYFAFYNVGSEKIRYRDIVEKGVRGIFLKSDDPELILEGIDAIMNGELWFPRDPMKRIVVDSLSGQTESSPEESRLSLREKEILGLMSTGISNADIADSLGISIHTVKSHLSNIFRKIEVPNRLQAALWAAKNLK